MRKRSVTGIWAIIAVMLFVVSGPASQAGGKPAGAKEGHKDHDGHFDECAKMCAKCMLVCEKNFHHCAMLAVEGKEEHAQPAALSLDCAELCAVSAKLCARHSALAGPACEACAKACDACAAACAKHKDDAMQACARVCRECAQSCREMVKHIGHEGHDKHDKREKADGSR